MTTNTTPSTPVPDRQYELRRAHLFVMLGEARLYLVGWPESAIRDFIKGVHAFQIVAGHPRWTLLYSQLSHGRLNKAWIDKDCVVASDLNGPETQFKTLSVWTLTAGEHKKRCERPASLIRSENLGFGLGCTGNSFLGLTIENDGARIAASNFWDSAVARAGYFTLSLVHGTLRLLVPDNAQADVAKMFEGVTHVEIKMLPTATWLEHQPCLRLIFAVKQGSTFVLDVGSKAFLGQRPGWIENKRLTLAVWTREAGQPHDAGELPATVTVDPDLTLNPWKF